jgi:amino acid adenylation domain-containing protein
LIVIPKKRHVTVRITYERGRFDGDTVARVTGHLQTVLEGMVANPDQPLASLPLLTEAERRQCVEEWSGATASYPKEKCLHDWFASQVERAPDAVAVVCQGERFTYRELNRRANQLAHYLRSLGVGPEVLVGVYLERSLDLVVALLATLKAGGAYVPLDPVYPRERLSLILTDARAPVLLTQQSLIEQLPEHPSRTVCLEAEAAAIAGCPADNPAAGTAPDNLAYVIYTSGSTGQPKGAQVSHYNVVRLLQATQDWYHFDDKDVWTLFHSFAFDFSVWEIWGALLYGGRLVVVPYRTSRAPDEFYDLLRAEGVTVLNQTPSAFRQLISLEETRGKAADDLALRLVIFGGEALEIKSLGPWFDRHGDQKPQLVNMYGITETTVHVTYRPLTAADLTSAPGSMIGRPIPDLALYVLDKHRRLLPAGVPGELYVGGVGVARGYLNRPELTAERFIDDPFRPGGRLYKSGDLARWLPDGDLEYLGRDDDQVKIRGFRIELGEIENALLHAPGVREAVVMARPQNEDPANKRAASNLYDPLGQLRKTLVQVIDKRLVAYVVPQADATVTAGTLRDFLKARLPDYMVPAAFVILDRLPLTANGKVDRKSLPAPGRSRADLNNPYEPPQTELEQLLASLWQDILKVDKVGLNDNFFEIGGNSVLGITFITRLQQRLGQIVQVVTLFDAPTVADLAAHLRKHYAAAVAKVCPNEPLLDAALAGGAEDTQVEPADLAHVRDILREHAVPLAASEPAGEGNGMPKNRPAVFVLSPPRSGTTLLRVILGGHPRLFAPPELELLSFATLQQRIAVFSGRDSFWLEGALRAVMEIKGCDADEAKRLMAECEDQDWTTRRFYRQLQDWLGDRLLVDKTPSYALRPQSLQRMEDEFDRPYYLHLLRHPQAVIRSFEEAKLDQLFFRYPHPFPTRKLAELIWTLSHQNIRAFLAQVPSERRLEVRFEDLVARPEAVVGEMCRFLGLDLEPAMLRPYEDKKGRMTDGIHPESRMLGDVKFHDYRGIEAKAADRWREMQAEDQLGEVTWQTAEALGYERAETGANGQAVNGQAAKLPSVLAPLRSGGSRQPFFCVHPLGGSVFPFGMLAYHLGKDQPFYGIQAQGMYGGEKPHTDMELMAADYMRAMRTVQPEGPYLVGGWSLGAVVAFEIAQQLHRENQQTALLAILDAPVFPSLFQPLNERNVKPEDVDDERSLGRLSNQLGISLTQLIQLKRDQQWALVAEQVKRANLVPPDINLKQFLRWVGVARANYRALMGYTVRPYPGPITVFRAGENDLRKLADTSQSLGWDKLSERIDIQPIPGDHRSMLREPNVRVLAERINACIDKALADHGVLSPR